MLDILILVGLILLMYSVSLWSAGQEHFEDGETVEPYDTFYADIYNILWHPKEKLGFEEVSIQDIALAGQPQATVKILDMACGTAPHACWFKNLGVDFTGIDISPGMLTKAKKDCPSSKFKKGDITNQSEFPPKTFTTCLLLGFAIYEFSNPKAVFDNAYLWLKPDGYLVVHMVDPDKYDALLDLASPFAAFSLQKYSYERQIKSEIYFSKFKYIGELKKKKDHDDAQFKETFVFFNAKKEKYREQVHEWNMPSVERLIEIAKTSGFRLKEKVSLTPASKEYQYLVYFTK
jgi:ubiquinone/menaquinone biosynthesis C-methylase UbiE